MALLAAGLSATGCDGGPEKPGQTQVDVDTSPTDATASDGEQIDSGDSPDGDADNVDAAIARVPCDGDSDCGPRGYCRLPDPALDLGKGGCEVRWAIDVEASRDFTCVRLGGGGYTCWGKNDFGQLGDGSTKDRQRPGSPILGPRLLRGLAIGTYHACATIGGHGAMCWGRDTSGQVSGKKTKVQALPGLVAVDTTRLPVAIGAGYLHSCALGIDGRTSCWGATAYGQTGGRKMPMGPHLLAAVPRLFTLDTANTFACGVTEKGAITCWGGNSDGQLGRGYASHDGEPAAIDKLAGARAITTGSRHACALLNAADGGTRATCWGDNNYGQLGLGHTTSVALPTELTGLFATNPGHALVQIDASAYHTCALGKTAVWCWGRNNWGQLGTGDLAPRRLPTIVMERGAQDGIVDIAAGFFHTCALERSGKLWCWGRNELGAVGIGSPSEVAIKAPTVVSAPDGALACKADADCGAAGAGCDELLCDAARGTCAVRPLGDGAPCLVDAIGCGISGTCEAGACAGADTCADGNACTVRVCAAGGKCATAPASGLCDDGDPCTPSDWCAAGSCVSAAWSCDDDNACTTDACDGVTGGCTNVALADGASCDDGFACTANDRCAAGECAAGPKKQCASGAGVCDQQVCIEGQGCVAKTACENGKPVMGPAVGLAAGDDFTCMKVRDGTVRCWGLNNHGQIGAGSIGGVVAPPQAVTGVHDTVAIDAGGAFACAVTDGGKVMCWGANGYGQLGGASKGPDSGTPAHVPQTVGFVALGLGRRHGCGIAGGRVWCWGDGGHGQLGPGETGVAGAALVAGVPRVSAIAAGGDLTCAIQAGKTAQVGGRVICWGGCEHGECGAGKTQVVAPPTFVRGLRNARFLGARAVAVGDGFACLSANNGTVWCWGQGGSGRLGHGTTASSLYPRRVATRRAGLVAVGAKHACGFAAPDDPLTCWGANERGQLGVGDLTKRPWAVPTSLPTDFRHVALGLRHTCAYNDTGEVRCTGYNAGGLLGVASKGANIGKFVPVEAAAVEPAKACTATSDCAANGPCSQPICTAHGRCEWRPKPCTDAADPCVASACGSAGCTAIALAPLGTDGSLPAVCDDGDPCTAVAHCKAGKCAVSQQACAAQPNVSGVVTYRHIKALSEDEGGPKLDYKTTSVRPARRIVVQALAMPDGASGTSTAGGDVLDETTTDNNGHYSLTVPEQTPFVVRVYAWIRAHDADFAYEKATGWPPNDCKHRAFDIRVLDNTNGKAQWAMQSPVQGPVQSPLPGGPAKSLNLHAETKFDPASFTYDQRTGGPFAIADSALEVMDLVCGSLPWLPTLFMHWSPNNIPKEGTKSKGQIGTSSHFTFEHGMPVIYLKGAENWNADEYDDHIVAHEVGHFVENLAFRSDSIGGQHTSGDALDPRVAFGEGYANALSAMALRDPVYVNTSGLAQNGGFQLRFDQLPAASDRGPAAETSIAWLLVKLWDNRDPLPMSGSFARIAEVLRTVHRPAQAFTNIATFVRGYLDRFAADDDPDGLRTLWTGPLDTPVLADPWDPANRIGTWYAARRSYPPGSGELQKADFWRLYRTLATGKNPPTAHDQLLLGGYSYMPNKLGASRWYRLRGTGKTVKVALSQLVGAACTDDVLDLRGYDRGEVIAYDTARKGAKAGCPSVEFATEAGRWYVLDARSAPSNAADVAGWTMTVSWL